MSKKGIHIKVLKQGFNSLFKCVFDLVICSLWVSDFLICKREIVTHKQKISELEDLFEMLYKTSKGCQETESLDHIRFGSNSCPTDFFASGLFTIFNVLKCAVHLFEMRMVHIFIQTWLTTEPFNQEVSRGTSVGWDTMDLV